MAQSFALGYGNVMTPPATGFRTFGPMALIETYQSVSS
jgi:hypothetical protein